MQVYIWIFDIFVIIFLDTLHKDSYLSSLCLCKFKKICTIKCLTGSYKQAAKFTLTDFHKKM